MRELIGIVGTRLRVMTHVGGEQAFETPGRPVAIVSDIMARTLWPGRNPLGECLYIQELPCARVVGVVADAVRFRLREEPHMHYYVPIGQETGMGGTVLLVRPSGTPAALAGTVRRALLDMDPALGHVETQSVQEMMDPQVRPWKLGAAVFGFAGLLALVVAAMFLVLIMRGLRASLGAPDDFGRFLAFGVTLLLGLEAFVNIAVVMGMLPTKVLALPFLSYGGTSLLTTLLAVGILLNISSQATGELR